jgi:Ribbon-helix-helix protein, copG family
MKLRTNIYLESRQADALDKAAQARGISRAEVVRELIDRGIAGEPALDLETDLAAIEHSFGALRGDRSGLASRGPDARSRHLDRIARR